MKIFKTLIFMILFSVSIFAQSNAIYDLSHNVIAGGGGKSSSALYKLEGTIGQAVAGTISSGTNASTNGQHKLRGGFWSSEPLAPTAATVALSGQITSKGTLIVGRPRVILTDTLTGATRSAEPSPFGFYRFEELEIGRVYIVRAESDGFAFTPDSYSFVLMDDRADVDFVGARIQ